MWRFVRPVHREGAAAAGHVEPRRHEGEGARRRPRARRVPSVEGGEGESGAGGLGEDADAAGGHGARVGGGVADAVVLEPRVRRLEVLERGGVRMLGREAQLGRDDRDAQLCLAVLEELGRDPSLPEVALPSRGLRAP